MLKIGRNTVVINQTYVFALSFFRWPWIIPDNSWKTEDHTTRIAGHEGCCQWSQHPRIRKGQALSRELYRWVSVCFSFHRSSPFGDKCETFLTGWQLLLSWNKSCDYVKRVLLTEYLCIFLIWLHTGIPYYM